MIMESKPSSLLKTHENLVHSEFRKVISHVQREQGDWWLNTIMIEGCEVPFKYKRKKLYRNLKGARVDMTYYPSTETVAGMEVEIMKVVRIRLS
jgi:hypothetical protein